MATLEQVGSGDFGRGAMSTPQKIAQPLLGSGEIDFNSTLSTQYTPLTGVSSPLKSPTSPTQDAPTLDFKEPKISLRAEIERLGLRGFLQGVRSRGEAMTSLELSENILGDEGAATLREVLTGSPHLRRLGLLRTGLGEAGLEQVGALMEQCSSLETVVLGGVELRGRPVPAALCGGVATAPSLRVLHLSHCRLTTEQIRPLLDILAGDRALQLERLNLAYNELDEKAMVDFHRVFEVSTSLTTLTLTANTLGPRGGEVLAEGILKAPGCRLRQLQVDKNGLTLRGCRSLVRMWLQTERSRPLSLLNIQDNALSQSQCHELCKALGKPELESKLSWDGGARQVLLSWPDRQGSIVYDRHTTGRTVDGQQDFALGTPMDVRWRR